jgi:hypothetical protein
LACTVAANSPLHVLRADDPEAFGFSTGFGGSVNW